MTIFYRRLPQFDYLRPQTIEAALLALSDAEPVRNQVFSGGTDLIPKLKSRAIKAPPQVIDLKGIPGLDYIEFAADRGLRIGANAIIREVARSEDVSAHYTALAEGASLIASNQLQHRGTIVGNVCNAVPSADSAPPLLAHDAEVAIVGRGGERRVAIADFFITAGVSCLKAGEIVREIVVPPPAHGERSLYLKLAARGRMDLAVVGVAAAVVVADGMFRQVRIGLGSAAPIPIRATQAERHLIGKAATAENIGAAAALAAADTRTRSSHRASADYRREMIEVLVRRALGQLAGVDVGVEAQLQ
ncbi:MAG: FAD binding domain-containing protein [Rhodocyclales bacterium]|nr:FAD binding domain-containing protein [Rhodocyclales bacterium]